jgi:hypothetical protein
MTPEINLPSTCRPSAFHALQEQSRWRQLQTILVTANQALDSEPVHGANPGLDVLDCRMRDHSRNRQALPQELRHHPRQWGTKQSALLNASQQREDRIEEL